MRSHFPLGNDVEPGERLRRDDLRSAVHWNRGDDDCRRVTVVRPSNSTVLPCQSYGDRGTIRRSSSEKFKKFSRDQPCLDKELAGDSTATVHDKHH